MYEMKGASIFTNIHTPQGSISSQDIENGEHVKRDIS